MQGQIVNLFIKPQHGAAMRPVETCYAISGEGLQGDVSQGRTKRQLLLIERETLDAFGLLPGQVRENITVAGVQLAGLEPATTIQIGHASIEVTGDCSPCSFIEQLRPGLMSAMDGRRGTLARVISGGMIQIGDSIRIHESG